MNSREFRQRISDILTRQREERIEAIHKDVRAEKKPQATEKPKSKRRKAS